MTAYIRHSRTGCPGCEDDEVPEGSLGDSVDIVSKVPPLILIV